MQEALCDGIEKDIPENAVLIIGAGHFGHRAARIMSQESPGPLLVLDKDEKALSGLNGLQVVRIQKDGTLFLAECFHKLTPEHTIVPAVPLHLAYEWMKAYMKETHTILQTPVPDAVRAQCPFWWDGSEGSLLVSYANFLCPDDCPEPEYCTVTGERRDNPLYRLIGGLKAPGLSVHVIRSHQLAPGLGGYKVKDLAHAVESISGGRQRNWLLATACKCHGIVTAFEIFPLSQRDGRGQ